MALVRCPKHKIPYNDSNPRGCPACAQEKEGGGRSSTQFGAMQELARASQMVKRPSGSDAAIPDFPLPDGPITTQPRIPIPVVTRLTQFLLLLRTRQTAAIGGAAILVLVLILAVTAGAHFTPADSPARYNGVVRPFPVMPNDQMAIVFSSVGPQTSKANPTSRSLERYSYGTDLFVDALNGQVYALTIAVPNRSWRGLRVGMDQTNAEGALAMLGTPHTSEAEAASRPDTISGFVVYRSLEARPRRALVAEVRPPNNCYDVVVILQPRATGVLRKGGDRWAVISRVGASEEWVVTRMRVVSRSMNGPYAGAPVC